MYIWLITSKQIPRISSHPMVQSTSFPTGNPLVTVTHRQFSPLSYIWPLSSNHAPIFYLANPSLWIIELHNGQDNRLTHELINKGLMPAFDMVEREWRIQLRTAQQSNDKEGGRGSLIIVGRRDQDKFFSNGDFRPCFSFGPRVFD